MEWKWLKDKRLSGAAWLWALGALASIGFGQASQAPAELRNGDFVAYVGDSITQQRRYTALVEAYLVACQPTQVRSMQFGWAGDTIANVNNRAQNDVMRFKPDVVTLCVGMNDGAYRAFDPDRAATFEAGVRQFVKTAKAAGVRRIILASPGAVDTTTFKRTEPAVYNDTLRRFGKIAQRIATDESVEFADLHTPMIEAMRAAKAKLGNEFTIANPDGFHPNWAGSMAMAYGMIKAIVGTNEIGQVTVDFAAGSAEASTGHVVKSVSSGKVEIQSTRYPFCYFDDAAPPGGTRSIAPFLPMNDELNRFVLVVKNAPAKSRVTWGKTSREFSSDELAGGVNLAGVFMNENPFVAPFADVFKAVEAKQRFEIPMMKNFINPLPQIELAVPEHKADLERIMKTFQTKHAALEADIQNAMKPVTHVIQIDAVQ